MENYSDTLKTLELLLELFRDQSLSRRSMCIAGGTIVMHEIAHIKGETVEGPEAQAWAIAKLEELEQLGQLPIRRRAWPEGKSWAVRAASREGNGRRYDPKTAS